MREVWLVVVAGLILGPKKGLRPLSKNSLIESESPGSSESPSSPASQVDYTDVLEQLKDATLFDLYRLSCVLNRMLDDPDRIERVKQTVRVGGEIEYFDPAENRSVKAMVLRCNRTRAVVRNVDDGVIWKITYCSINTGGKSSTIHEHVARGLGRHEVSVGERVGFLDKDNQERFGTITRLNPKTVTLICDDEGQSGKWLVDYTYLFRVLDANASKTNSNIIEAHSVVHGKALSSPTSERQL